MSLKVSFGDRIQQGIDKLVVKVADNLRPAAQAGAQVYYDEVKARVPVSEEAHIFTSRRHKDGTRGALYLYYPGNLRDSIYQKYVDDRTSLKGPMYVVSYRKGSSIGLPAAPYGAMVEHGTSKMAARPFIAPSYDAKRNDAVAAVRKALREGLKK